jgi:S-adenosylhomocysteine hydrolase
MNVKEIAERGQEGMGWNSQRVPVLIRTKEDLTQHTVLEGMYAQGCQTIEES